MGGLGGCPPSYLPPLRGTVNLYNKKRGRCINAYHSSQSLFSYCKAWSDRLIVVFTTSRPSRHGHIRPSRRPRRHRSRPSRHRSRPSRPSQASPSRDPSHPSHPTRRRPPVLRWPGVAARKVQLWLISSQVSSFPYLFLLQSVRNINIDKMLSNE